MIITFEDFWTKLTADDLWWDRMKYTYGRKDLKKIGNDTYDFLLTQPNRLKADDPGDWRRLFKKTADWAKDKPAGVELQQAPKEVKKEPDHTPTSPERRARWLKVYLWKIQKSKITSTGPRLSLKQIAEEGDWLPKKDAPYIQPVMEILQTQQRIQAETDEGRRRYFMATYPGATEDDVQDYLSKFEPCFPKISNPLKE